MRFAWMLALAVLIGPEASAAAVDPTEAWRPMHVFIGTWKGTRSGAEGPTKVTRVYAPAATNHHLEITEKGGGSPAAVWGVVSFDAQRQALVLRHFAADGSASDTAFDSAASSDERIVFASPESDAGRTRITYERTGWNAFVERIELAQSGGPYTVVLETRFERKN